MSVSIGQTLNAIPGMQPLKRELSKLFGALSTSAPSAITAAAPAAITAAAAAAPTAVGPSAPTAYAAVATMTDPVTKAEGEAVSSALNVLVGEVTTMNTALVAEIADRAANKAEIDKLVTDLTATRAEVAKLVTDITALQVSMAAVSNLTA